MCLSSDGRDLYWRSNDRVARLDVATGQIVAWRDVRSRPTGIKLSNTGAYLAVRFAHGPVEVLDAQNLKPIAYVAQTEGGVSSLAFSPDDLLLAVACDSGLLSLVQTADGRSLARLQIGAPQGMFVAHGMCFTSDGALLLCVGRYRADVGQPASGLLVALGSVRSADEIRARFRRFARGESQD